MLCGVHANEDIPAGLFADDAHTTRCAWCQATPLYRHYHDSEWGFPLADVPRLFEKICLEGFQAGLSWLTILNKRETFRSAFANFDAERVARFDASDTQRLLPRCRCPKTSRKRGWTFVGPTTMHAFMQAMGLINDPLEGCASRQAALAARAAFTPLR